jgi:superfamily II RNA helicase
VSRELLEAPGRKNLLVASPTGSGKTFVIEECVRLARRDGQRLFVAEPLIALVEQIFSRIGGTDLAMRTGPSCRGQEDAAVCVCTYEVLARLAAVEPQALDGCPRLVIDEFHFLGSDRGPVLQEILAHCREGREVVALSGTMPNVHELAAFLARLNGFPTFVVGAARRPIEIGFYHYACDRDRMSHLRPPVEPRQQPPFRAQDIGGIRDRQGLFRLLEQLQAWDCLPALFVAFSCRKLDEYAEWTASARDYADRSARSHVAVGFRKLLKEVAEEDAPLFARYRAWAERGVAVHHSHAPVQYLELVSWLAERRALKVVFSSSTLSAGINLPVRTVCVSAASVPQKNADGGMAHVNIPPLLFHQLVGRAGRPGFETVGNCIILGRDVQSYGSAQALMQCLIPPVRPQASFGAGEVLRALRSHRSVAHEAMAVLSAADHELLRQAERDAALEAQALELCGTEERALLRRQAEAALEVQRWAPKLRDFARAQSTERVFLVLTASGIAVRETVAAAEDGAAEAYALTCKSQVKKLPFTEADAILAARTKVRELLGGRHLDSRQSALRDVVYCARRSAAALADAPLQDLYRATLKELRDAGCVDDRDCLTALGRAACELRTCPQPHFVLRSLLTAGEVGSRDALLFASQVLAEGGGRSDEVGPARCSVLAALESPALCDVLRRLDPLTLPAWTLAAARWADGASLVELEAEVAVGCLCRHLVRVADCCEELAQALEALGASGAAFRHATARVARGLPFAKRGAWKRAVADEPSDD